MALRGNDVGFLVEPVYAEIGRRLRWLREQKGLGLSQLAIALPVSVGALGNWEKGVARIGVAELLKIVNVFGVDVALVLSDLDIKSCELDPKLVAWRKERARKRMVTLRAQGKMLGHPRKPAKRKKG